MFIYRSFFYLLGLTIKLLGVSLIVKSAFGTGYWSALFVGIYNNFGITVGFWCATIQLLIVFVNAHLLQKRPQFEAIIALIIDAIIFDFWLEIALRSVDLQFAPIYTQVIVFICGLMLTSLGVTVYIQSGFPKAPLDQLFLAVSKRFHCSIGTSQTMIALTTSCVAFFLGGPVGIGTAIATFSIGPMIQFFDKRCKLLYKPLLLNAFMGSK